MAVLFHIVFLPLFVFGARPAIFPPVFGSQIYEISIGLLLGISTGLIGCSAAMMVPELVRDSARERAGFLSTLCLVSGLFTGSLVAIPLGELFE